MKIYTYILFDLDGTITDSAPGITNAAAYALSKYDIHESPDTLHKFIGPPLYESFKEFYNLDDPMEAVEHFRDYYKSKGMLECLVYESLEDLLKSLKTSNMKLLVATSKPEKFAKEILKHFKLDHYFDFIGGATLDESRSKKDQVIKYVLEENQITDLSKVIMIGDRKHDIEGAKDNHIDSIGVLYGYGDLKELEAAGADYIVKDLLELKSLLEGK